MFTFIPRSSSQNESFAKFLACSSLYFMIHRENYSSFIPFTAWINPFVIVFNLRNVLYILSWKCWIPKTKNFRIFKFKYSKTINMFSNDDYEFEDLANQMSQTQINESGNIGGLSMLWTSRSFLTFISWKIRFLNCCIELPRFQQKPFLPIPNQNRK